MGDLIAAIRDRILNANDTVCLDRARLVTEAYAKHQDDPVPLKRAHAFAHVLRNMQLDLDTNPVFAGNTSSAPRAWMLVPEFGFWSDTQVLIENDGLEGLLDGQIPEDLSRFWAERSYGGSSGVGHLAVNLDTVVHTGLRALIDECQTCSSRGTQAEQTYRRAMAIALEGVVSWARRYAEAARDRAANSEDAALRAMHERVAEACERVPEHPARNLFEGLQAIALVHLAIAIEGHGMSVSIGLPDRVLEPFIDTAPDEREVVDLLSAFMLKINANSLYGRGSKTQPFTVGGVDHTGRDRCNRLTLLFLKACDRVRVGDPHLFLRWHEAIDNECKLLASDMLSRGVSMPLLIGDVPTARGFEHAGVPAGDAWSYCVIGCNELGIPGLSADSATSRAGLVQHLALLNQTLFEHEHPDELRSVDDILRAMEARLRDDLMKARERGEQRRQRAIAEVPTPFTSSLMDGCVASGRDMLEGMTYHLPGVYERGITNAANALAAIDDVVFKRRTKTLSDLVAALQDGLGDEMLRSELRGAAKWGNDDDEVDRWALALVAMRERVLDDVDRAFGHAPHMVCHVVRSLHYVDGRKIAASPDGRLAWTPVADSIGAETGTSTNGPTGILNSVLKLEAEKHYRGGTNLNLTLPGTRPEVVRGLVEAFFDEGGQELQINALDAETLRDAQAHPERHGDLIVRVAGFSARFVDLSKVEQDELVARAVTA